MLQPVILFRSDFSRGLETEANIASKYFKVVSQRTSCKSNYVIGRYSVLPYYKELERDLDVVKCRLINNYNEHKYIADMHWTKDIKDTPMTWDDNNFYKAPEGQYIVKGRTNSIKAKWDTCMFAKTKRQAQDIAGELCSDSLIGPQTIVYRNYVPLITYEVGINGLPFTHEFRVFCYNDKILCHAYYWSIAEKTDLYLDDEGLQFTQSICNDIHKNKSTHFYVLDVAKDVNGKWWLIEINDGQMSGLSMCDPHELYGNLRKALDEQTK